MARPDDSMINLPNGKLTSEEIKSEDPTVHEVYCEMPPCPNCRLPAIIMSNVLTHPMVPVFLFLCVLVTFIGWCFSVKVIYDLPESKQRSNALRVILYEFSPWTMSLLTTGLLSIMV